MKNKKAWLRILEAFLAVMIILSAVLIIMSKQKTTVDLSEEIIQNQDRILDIISKNNTLREKVILKQEESLTNEISKMIPPTMKFAIKICEIESACYTDKTPNDKEVYTREVLITSTLEQYSPKKLRFFVWLG